MKILSALFASFVLAIGPMSNAEEDSQRTPIQLFIVSETEFGGSRHFDTLEFPNLGFIAHTPDLTISKIESVVAGPPTEVYGPDKAGNMGRYPSQRTLMIKWFDEDAEKFRALTKRAINKRVLVMIAGKPLMAPQVRNEIAMKSAQISLGKDLDDEMVIRSAFESLVTTPPK